MMMMMIASEKRSGLKRVALINYPTNLGPGHQSTVLAGHEGGDDDDDDVDDDDDDYDDDDAPEVAQKCIAFFGQDEIMLHCAFCQIWNLFSFDHNFAKNGHICHFFLFWPYFLARVATLVILVLLTMFFGPEHK